MQLELTYLYSMEHFFNFFYAQAPNSAGANAFCNSYYLIESVTTYSDSQCEKTRSGIA